MWFVLAAIALTVVIIGGIYTRRRVLVALADLGASPAISRRTGVAIRWFLFGYPALFIGFVLISLALGRDSINLPVTPLVTWGLSIPFWVSMLVMLQALPYLLLLDGVRLVLRALRKPGPSPRLRAVITLVPVAAFMLYTPLRIALESDVLNVRTYQVGEGETVLRIAFVGDLQQDNRTSQDRADEVVARVNAQSPDVVLSGGDWINTGPSYIEAATRSAGMFRSRYGTLSAEGDHENFAYRDQERSMREVREGLAKHGVAMLHNEWRTITHEGKRVSILFLAYNYIYRTPEEQIAQLLAEDRGTDYRIVVSHQFDAKLAALVKDRVELVLAAHTHGGQVNPVVGLWHVPLARVETKYISGRYTLGERTQVIVTSGIGFSLAPFRYASPSSVEILELRL